MAVFAAAAEVTAAFGSGAAWARLSRPTAHGCWR